MTQNEDSLKAFSSQLASLLDVEGGIQGVSRIFTQQLAAFKRQNEDAQSARNERSDGGAIMPPAASNIGIWEPIQENGKVSFVRTRNKNDWRLWANVEYIAPKGDKPRVVLLGESVARSYLIDPHYNCAAALRHSLRSATGADDVEVVDIARSGMLLNQLREFLVPTLALEPDAYVIFAGNNWAQGETLNVGKMAAMLRDAAGWKPIKIYLEEIIREQACNLIRYLGRFSAENGVPIIFIIPEFNLLDWQIECGWRNPLLTADSARQSLCNNMQAEKALADGNWHLAAALAEEIDQIEEGTNPIGVDILARCKFNQGKITDARRFKERAADNIYNLAFSIIPRCFSVAQEAFRRESAMQGITLVDLPRRFQEYLPSGLPGRKFFYDHCHMTAEGIRLAMASTAEKLLSLLGKPERSWSELNQLEFAIDPRGLAQSHFAAAHVNAIWGQDYNIIRFHCAEALKHDPEIADLMLLFINIHVRQTNVKYIKDIESFLGGKGLHCYRFHKRPIAGGADGYAPAKFMNDQGLHLPLIRSLTEVLSVVDPDLHRSTEILLRQERGVSACGIDLLQRPYMDLAQGQQEYDWLRTNVNYKTYRPESSFRLICENSRPIRISIVCRVPNADAVTGAVALLLNGRVVHEIFAESRWVTSEFVIPAELLYEGINSIIIRWPEPNQSRKDRVERAAEKLEEIALWGNYLDVFRVYGEVHVFKASLEDAPTSACESR